MNLEYPDLPIASIIEVLGNKVKISKSQNNCVEQLAEEILNKDFIKDVKFPTLQNLKTDIFDNAGNLNAVGTNTKLNPIQLSINSFLGSSSPEFNKFKHFAFRTSDPTKGEEAVFDFLNDNTGGALSKLKNVGLGGKTYASNELAKNVYDAYKAYEDATAKAKNLTDAELTPAKLDVILAPFATGAGAAVADDAAFKNAIKDLICQEFPEIGSGNNPLNIPALAALDALITALHGAGGDGTPPDVATLKRIAAVVAPINNLKDGIKVAVKECKVSKAPGAANGLPALAKFDLQSIFEYSRTNLNQIMNAFKHGINASDATHVDLRGVANSAVSGISTGADRNSSADNIAALQGILGGGGYVADGSNLGINGSAGPVPAGFDNSGYLNDKSLGALIRSLAAICNNNPAANNAFRSAEVKNVFEKFDENSRNKEFFNLDKGISQNIKLTDLTLSKRSIAVIQLLKDDKEKFFKVQNLTKLFGKDSIVVNTENATETVKNIFDTIKDDDLNDMFKEAPFGIVMPKADFVKLLLIAHFNKSDSVKNSTLQVADLTSVEGPNRALILCPKDNIKIDQAFIDSLNNLINSGALFQKEQVKNSDITNAYFDDTVEGASYQLLFELLGGRLAAADEDTKSIYGNKRSQGEIKDVASFVFILDRFRLMAKEENEQPLLDLLKKMGDDRKEAQLPLLYFIDYLRSNKVDNKFTIKNPLKFMKGLYALKMDKYDELKNKVLNPSAADETPKHEYANVAKLTAALVGITTDTEIIKAIAALFEKKADATQNDKDKVQKFLIDNKTNTTNDVIIKIKELKLLKNPVVEEGNTPGLYKDLGFSDEDSNKLKALVDKINAANFDPKTLTDEDKKLFESFKNKVNGLTDATKKDKYADYVALESKLKEQAPVPTVDLAKELADKKTEATGLLDKNLTNLSKAAADKIKSDIEKATKKEEVEEIKKSIIAFEESLKQINLEREKAKGISEALSELEGKVKGNKEKEDAVKALLDAINKVVTNFTRIEETCARDGEGLGINALNSVIKCKDANNKTVDITPANVIKALDEAVKAALKKLTDEKDDANLSKMAENVESFKQAISKFAEAPAGADATVEVVAAPLEQKLAEAIDTKAKELLEKSGSKANVLDDNGKEEFRKGVKILKNGGKVVKPSEKVCEALNELGQRPVEVKTYEEIKKALDNPSEDGSFFAFLKAAFFGADVTTAIKNAGDKVGYDSTWIKARIGSFIGIILSYIPVLNNRLFRTAFTKDGEFVLPIFKVEAKAEASQETPAQKAAKEKKEGEEAANPAQGTTPAKPNPAAGGA